MRHSTHAMEALDNHLLQFAVWVPTKQIICMIIPPAARRYRAVLDFTLAWTEVQRRADLVANVGVQERIDAVTTSVTYSKGRFE